MANLQIVNKDSARILASRLLKSRQNKRGMTLSLKNQCRLIANQNIIRHLVFVYGTLKKGEPNHNYLEVKENGYVRFLSKAKTVKKYPLIIATKYNIPFLLYTPGKGQNVIGEVYEVDDYILDKLDQLENHPTFYIRESDQVEIISEEKNNGTITYSETKKECWIYFLKQFKPYLLSEPYLTEYHSKGDHLRPYVPFDERPSDYQVRNEVLPS